MLVELVGGPRDGHLLAVSELRAEITEPAEVPACYVADGPPVVSMLRTRRYRLVRRRELLAWDIGGLMVPAGSRYPLAGEPITADDVDLAGGWRYVLVG